MKKILLLFAVVFSLHAQVPCNLAGTFTATGTSTVLDNRKLGCYQFRVSYNSTGFSALSVQLEQAPDNGGVPGSWAAFTGSTVVTDGSNPSTNTNAAIIGVHSAAAWVRLNLASKTGSGALVYQVWGANSISTAGYINGIAPIVVAGNTVSCPTCATGSGVTAVTATSPIASTGGNTPVISCPTCSTATPVTAVTATSPIASSGGTTPVISCPTCSTATPVTAVTATSPIVSTGGITPVISCPTCGTGGGGAMVQLNQLTATGSSPTFNFTSISGAYSSLLIIVTGRSAVAATSETLDLTINGNSGANYIRNQIYNNSSVTAATFGATGQSKEQSCTITGNSFTASYTGSCIITIPLYASTSFFKQIHISSGFNGTTPVYSIADVWSWFTQTAAVTSVTLTADSGANIQAGSVATLYGIQ